MVEPKELVAVLEPRGLTECIGTATDTDGAAGFAQSTWRKSSCSACNGNCVEIAELRGRPVAVGDSDSHGPGPVLIFGPSYG